MFRRTLKPEQQAFALIALSQTNESIPQGRKRLKAYHKLRKLKEDLQFLIERAKSGEDISVDLSNLLKPKKKDAIERSIFEMLNDKLHLFEPSWSDGDEHLFIRQIEKAISTTIENEIQKYHRDALILTLERLSQEFLKYSENLKTKSLATETP